MKEVCGSKNGKEGGKVWRTRGGCRKAHTNMRNAMKKTAGKRLGWKNLSTRSSHVEHKSYVSACRQPRMPGAVGEKKGRAVGQKGGPSTSFWKRSSILGFEKKNEDRECLADNRKEPGTFLNLSGGDVKKGRTRCRGRMCQSQLG